MAQNNKYKVSGVSDIFILPLGLPTSVKTSAYSALAGDLVRVDPTSGGFTVTLPSAALSGSGAAISVKNVSNSANSVTVACSGSDTTDGDASTLVDSRVAIVFVSDGVSDWMRF